MRLKRGKTMAVSTAESFETICKEIHDSPAKGNRLIPLVIGLSQLDCRKVRETYMKIYGEDLTRLHHNLENDGGGVVPSVVSLMMLNPSERDAAVARKALRQNSTDYGALVEIYTSRKSSHVLLIQQAYHARYRSHLDLDISALEPPHPFQKILLALSASHKAHSDETSQHIAKCDAKRLYETGEGKARAGIDEAVVLEIFSKRSVAQLKLTFSSYRHIYGHSYTSFLKKVDCGAIGDAVRSAAKCICNPPRYYAEVVYGWFKGRRSDEGAIERVMVSRVEADMDEIERELKKKYGADLKGMICEIVPQGNERDLLLAIAANNSTC